MNAYLSALSAAPGTLSGTYVEARTSEIFAGACIINGEAATTGREALLAWKVDRGQFNGRVVVLAVERHGGLVAGQF